MCRLKRALSIAGLSVALILTLGSNANVAAQQCEKYSDQDLADFIRLAVVTNPIIGADRSYINVWPVTPDGGDPSQRTLVLTGYTTTSTQARALGEILFGVKCWV